MLILESSICMNASFLATVLFIKKIIEIIIIIIPIALILLVTIDMAKAVMANDDNEIKKAQNLAIRRIIYAVVIFLVPTVIDATFNLLGKEIEGLSCYSNATEENVDKLSAAQKESDEAYMSAVEQLIEQGKVNRELAEKEVAELRKKVESEGHNSSSKTTPSTVVTSYRKTNGYISHASHGPGGRIDTKGDQSGKEVAISKRNNNWTYIARFKNPDKAEKAAICGEQGAKNNHIGYGVNGYSTLYKEAKKLDWDLSRITKDVNTTCSTFVAVCINAAGTKITKDLNGFANVKPDLQATSAFTIMSYNKDNVMRGDILVREKKHMAIAL